MSGSRPIVLVALLSACALLAAAGGKKKEAEPYAIVAGTVFRDPGYALPDATVTLTLRDDPKAKKLQQAVTSPRGEFSFHVPLTPATYVVKATLKGYRPEQKEASINGPEEVDVTLVLAPESK